MPLFNSRFRSASVDFLHGLQIKSQRKYKIVRKIMPTPYNWRTYPQMNVNFWKKHQNTLYELAAENLKKTHSETMRLIDTFSDEQLFTKNIFSWTGSTPLGTYCVSATSSHYDWAIKCIKQAIKSFRARN